MNIKVHFRRMVLCIIITTSTILPNLLSAAIPALLPTANNEPSHQQPAYLWPCNDKFGTEIEPSRLCDGYQDCWGWEDETTETCQEEIEQNVMFDCQNGRAIPIHWLCDYKNDCGNQEDEKVEVCQSLAKQGILWPCGKTFILPIQVCNNNYDCYSIRSFHRYVGLDKVLSQEDESRETCGTDKSSTPVLTTNAWSCYNYSDPSQSSRPSYTKEFIPVTQTCNGIADCVNNADEENSLCKGKEQSPCYEVVPYHNRKLRLKTPWTSVGFSLDRTSFKCQDGQVIRWNEVCNGQTDCNDQSEEDPVTCNNLIKLGYIHECKNGKRIVFWEVCSGYYSCDDSKDWVDLKKNEYNEYQGDFSDQSKELCAKQLAIGTVRECQSGIVLRSSLFCNRAMAGCPPPDPHFDERAENCQVELTQQLMKNFNGYGFKPYIEGKQNDLNSGEENTGTALHKTTQSDCITIAAAGVLTAASIVTAVIVYTYQLKKRFSLQCKENA